MPEPVGFLRPPFAFVPFKSGGGPPQSKTLARSRMHFGVLLALRLPRVNRQRRFEHQRGASGVRAAFSAAFPSEVQQRTRSPPCAQPKAAVKPPALQTLRDFGGRSA